MDANLFFGVSLTASFLAGVMALFAPCCITFLFPSYLGTIFKEKEKIVLYTVLFALGIGIILMPVALGFRFFVFLLDDFHKQIYYLGGLVLLLMGVMTVKPFFQFPEIFHFKRDMGKKVTAGSAFGLGVISGLTSACCAPVLIAAVTLTTLSPSLVQALFVAFAYVLGIVFPLFIMSLGYEKMTGRVTGENRQKVYTIFKWLAAAIFFVSGILVIVFNYMNKIEMYQMEGYSRQLRLAVFQIAKYFQNPAVDILTFALIVFIFYKLISPKNGKKTE